MICYYSGTGNTRLVASTFAEQLHDDTVLSIPDILHMSSKEVETLPKSGRVGILFPIYSWGIPPIVVEFIKKNLPGLCTVHTYLWSVCTPGDEAGIAMRIFRKLVRRQCGLQPALIASIIMPNDYVLLPGFTVDSKEIERQKLQAMPGRVQAIAEQIKKKATGIYDVKEGSAPALRTRLVYPLFKRWGVKPTKWNVDTAKCIRCGKCSKACPSLNITLPQGTPVWSKNCLSCCACFNICPVNAINYGKITRGKKQYFCPAKTAADILEL